MKGCVPQGKILIKEIDVRDKTESGIILHRDGTQNIGRVLIGNDDVKEGDEIIYKNQAPSPISVRIDNETFWLLRDSSVLYVF